MKKFDIEKLKKRILEISFRHKLSHIGSSLTAMPIICEIFEKKREEDIFVLSSGHAGLAYYVVLENLYGHNAEKLLETHGIHPHRDMEHNIFCSTGSLGVGITIGVGAAFASPDKNVYVLCSDGETKEGSFWEALQFLDDNVLKNCKIYVNINGYSAYKQLNPHYVALRIRAFLPTVEIRYTNVNQYPFLKGLDAHYYTMHDEDYKLCQK